MTPQTAPRPIFARLAAVLAASAFAAPVLAGPIYSSVEVRGAELVPEEDIALTCGDLTGIEIDEITRQSIEDCLMMTGVFKRVALIPNGDTLVIDVEEIEARPGQLDFGIAWESDNGLTGTIAYEQFNLIPDSYLAIRSSYAREYRSYDVNLYRRKALSDTLHLGFQLTGERAYYDDLPYKTDSDRVEVYAAWTPSDRLRAELALGYRRHALYDVEPGASALLQREAGEVEAPYLHLVFSHQSQEEAKIGYSLRLDQYFWNLGTDQKLAETRAEAKLRYSVSEAMTLFAGFRGGEVRGLVGAQPTALDRAYLGGESLRGFAPRGIGPRDQGDALGGKRYAAASLELQRRLGTALETDFRGGIFVEAGALWDLDDTLGGSIDDKAHLRTSLGLTLSFDIGKVPVSLYLAKPVERREGDEEQVFGLTASARF